MARLKLDGVVDQPLSPQMVTVMEWVCQGKTSTEIGIITGLSHYTVEAYIKASVARLGAVNRVQAAVLFDRQQNARNGG